MDILAALGNIGFDWHLALANFINFLIVFWLLQRFVWRPLRAHIETRQAAIAQGLDDAREAEHKKAEAVEASRRILEEAKRERADLLHEAHLAGEQIVHTAGNAARAHAEAIMKHATEQAIELEREAKRRVRETAVELAVNATRAILQAEVDKKRGEVLIREMVK